jgi:hypothetical protein
MSIAGLPLHPLVVHAAVVFTPLAAALVIAFAVLPKWRWLTRWAATGTTFVALASVYVAKLTGKSLLNERSFLKSLPMLQTHQHRANILFLIMIGFMVLTAVGAWTLGGPTALASGRGAWQSKVAVLDKVMPVLLVAGAIAVLVSVTLTGDAGARSVWEQH